ncbi:hypothetical protein K2173_002424 [Erythroxylum novogranatense]|uniref:Filament-like plant protein 7 n=1 Tax=Erythroxylum novogranatense TaxID=1862640 RepID=A0AAV8T9N6_9ROSI|nr:hypothetical protein K2173_002424 [Erythroxylum novogranatense]
MDNSRTWLWRKKPSEKTIVTTSKFGMPVKAIDGEGSMLPGGCEVGPTRHLRNLNEKLASVLLDSLAKADPLTRHDLISKEAISGEGKSEEEVLSVNKGEYEQGIATNESSSYSDTAFKQCMLHVASLQEEQDPKIQDALLKASSEFQKVQRKLEDRLMEMSKNLANLAIENTNLSNALLVKENLVEELRRRATQTVAEFNALMARLDSTEKENAFLKYEFHMLEKELQVRNEKLEYTRQLADASHSQQLESVKKLAKLEAECQRLRALMQKRLPGLAATEKIKSEIEMHGRDPVNFKRKPNPTKDLILMETAMERFSETPVKKTDCLIERLRGMEQENRTLREIVTKKNAELQSSRIMFSRAASRLSQVEAKLLDVSGGQRSLELTQGDQLSQELYPIPGLDVCSSYRDSSSNSWADALISELEIFRDRKPKSPSESRVIEFPDMSLMHDFAEMEKLVVVSVEAPPDDDNHPSSAGKELVPADQSDLGCGKDNQEIHSKDIPNGKPFDWIQDVLNAMLKEQRSSKRSLIELLEDIKIALGYVHYANVLEDDATRTSRHHTESTLKTHIPLKSLTNCSSNQASNSANTAMETSRPCGPSSLSKSICSIVQLVEKMVLNSSAIDYSNSTPSAAASDYFVHVFQWRNCELNAVLQRFVDICKSLLDGKVGLEDFAEELLLTLDWTMNNVVTPQDASNARDKISKYFVWNSPETENQVGVAPVQSKPICLSKEQPSWLRLITSPRDHTTYQTECAKSFLQDENKRLKEDLKHMESAKRDVEDRLQSATNKTEVFNKQLEESERSLQSLKAEIDSLKESKGLIEDQFENQKSINEDLDTQLTVAKAKLNEVLQKLSSLEVELEDKNNCCEDLEATCLDLQLQVESVAKMETLNRDEQGTQPHNGWEMTSASIKLAECQETILNLGKQLRALASPREVALLDRVFTTTNATSTAINTRNFIKRFSLHDQMLAEDNAKAIILRSPTEDTHTQNPSHAINVLARKPDSSPAGALAIVPTKKHGGIGMLRRLLMRRKKQSVKKSQLPKA